MSELICRVDRARFAVHVIVFSRSGPWLARVERHAASVTEFPLRSLKSPSVLGRITALARWLRTQRIDVLHSCDIYANIVALPAGALARVPVRIGSRRGIVAPVAAPGMLALQRVAYTAAHRVVANSTAAAARLREERVAAKRILVIPNGIDLHAFPPAPRRPQRRVVATVANLRPGKGHDVLLRAAALVLRRHPDARFRLIGDGALRGSLEQTSRALGIADRVEFLGHRDDVAALLQASDLFAFPSLMEAFPNGLMEAMTVGLPVVATDVGGIPELIEHGRNGLLIPAGDVESLATGILRIMDESATADAWGRAGRETITARYSFARMVASFESLYLDTLTARNGQVDSALHVRTSEQP